MLYFVKEKVKSKKQWNVLESLCYLCDNTDPISVFPGLSKVYQRLMYNQISRYFNSVFSKFKCGFRKGFNAQHCLLTMEEQWRKTLDEGGETGVVTDLSKAFDCIDDNLLITKLNAYGFKKGR